MVTVHSCVSACFKLCKECGPEGMRSVVRQIIQFVTSSQVTVITVYGHTNAQLVD